MAEKEKYVMSEWRRKWLEEERKRVRERMQDPEMLKAFVRAGGSVSFPHATDSVEIARLERGKA